ncbi:sulfite exporter TauE/SafE family protein (plasmid) [Halarchaeum sp. CBA1220]|nr:sulfite exporter TauE/SafE family protein [Halarchaeum sp. CBA1220]
MPLHAGGVLLSNRPVELGVFLLIGLFGGAHCLGMCGPLVTTYAEAFASDDRGPTWVEIRQHVLFNAGRTVSYALIGGVFGLLGAALYSVAGSVLDAARWARVASGLLVGVFVVATGVSYLTGRGDLLGHLSTPLDGVFRTLSTHVDEWADSPRIAGLGLLHGLLPCPLIYPAFLYAFARGSITTGVLSLAALGLGTIPALFLYGTVLGTVDERLRTRLHRALGVAFVPMGWMPIAHALAVLGVPVPHLEVPYYQPLTP